MNAEILNSITTRVTELWPEAKLELINDFRAELTLETRLMGKPTRKFDLPLCLLYITDGELTVEVSPLLYDKPTISLTFVLAKPDVILDIDEFFLCYKRLAQQRLSATWRGDHKYALHSIEWIMAGLISDLHSIMPQNAPK